MLTLSGLFRRDDRPVVKTAEQGFERGLIELFHEIQESWQHVILGYSRELRVMADVQSLKEKLEGSPDKCRQPSPIRLPDRPLEDVEEAHQNLLCKHDQHMSHSQRLDGLPFHPPRAYPAKFREAKARAFQLVPSLSRWRYSC
jgi:hypothetical protein